MKLPPAEASPGFPCLSTNQLPMGVTLLSTADTHEAGHIGLARFYIGEARDWDGVARLGVDIGDLRDA